MFRWLETMIEDTFDRAFGNWCRKMNTRAADLPESDLVLTMDKPALPPPDRETEEEREVEQLVRNGHGRRKGKVSK